MAVTELIALRANYIGGQVRMTWRFPPSAPETVHIYGVKRAGEDISLDARFRISKDLRDCSGGLSFDYSGISSVDVKLVTFCVFLEDRNFNSPNMRALQSMKGCFTDVIIGRADVLYDVFSKPCAGELTSHRIVVKSSSTFDAGILGYSCDFYGKDIRLELPGSIGSGISQYPQIYLPRQSAPPVVCMWGGANADVMITRKKISVFRWPFSKSKF